MRSVLDYALNMTSGIKPAVLLKHDEVKPQNRASKPAHDPPPPSRHDARHPTNGRFVSFRNGKISR